MGGSKSRYADDVARIAAGDEAALVRIIEEFESLVRRIALRITGSEADAEDVTQEVFIGLPEALRSFSSQNFAGWLKVVARSRAQMLVRSERRRQRFRSSSSVSEGLDDRVLTGVMIETALTRIDARQREIFLLRWRKGLSHREIAERMDISETYSQVLLHRARKALKELLS